MALLWSKMYAKQSKVGKIMEKNNVAWPLSKRYLDFCVGIIVVYSKPAPSFDESWLSYYFSSYFNFPRQIANANNVSISHIFATRK